MKVERSQAKEVTRTRAKILNVVIMSLDFILKGSEVKSYRKLKNEMQPGSRGSMVECHP